MFIEGGKFDDHLNPIESSQMYKMVDGHINAVTLIVTLPSLEEIEKDKLEKKEIEEGKDPSQVEEKPSEGEL